MRILIIDSYDGTKYIKSTTKGNATAVMALTTSLLEEEKAIVISGNCDDFLRKPFTEHSISEALAKYLGVKYLYAKTTALNLDSSEASTLTSEHLTCMS
ncbi:hypothetical protein [Trichormus azollae]|uniref:hypothetical protein n=1 Tax=Trichormus azollae TaxID=1164 RepID=UPI00325DAF5D